MVMPFYYELGSLNFQRAVTHEDVSDFTEELFRGQVKKKVVENIQLGSLEPIPAVLG